jgi:hypothetical protein
MHQSVTCQLNGESQIFVGLESIFGKIGDIGDSAAHEFTPFLLATTFWFANMP